MQSKQSMHTEYKKPNDFNKEFKKEIEEERAQVNMSQKMGEIQRNLGSFD